MRQLVAELEDEGYAVTRTGSGHYKVNKDDGPSVFMPHSPSDTRGFHRIYRKLRTIGFERRKKR
jgi:hypothetical protein